MVSIRSLMARHQTRGAERARLSGATLRRSGDSRRPAVSLRPAVDVSVPAHDVRGGLHREADGDLLADGAAHRAHSMEFANVQRARQSQYRGAPRNGGLLVSPPDLTSAVLYVAPDRRHVVRRGVGDRWLPAFAHDRRSCAAVRSFWGPGVRREPAARSDGAVLPRPNHRRVHVLDDEYQRHLAPLLLRSRLALRRLRAVVVHASCVTNSGKLVALQQRNQCAPLAVCRPYSPARRRTSAGIAGLLGDRAGVRRATDVVASRPAGGGAGWLTRP